MKNILIISNFFYPELTPRAFRVHELIKEFTKLGHKVTLVLPNKEIYHNNKVNIEGLNIIYSNSKKIIDGSNKNPLDIIIHNNKIRFFIMKIGKFFFPKEIFLTYDSGITNVFKSINNEFDILISISQPLSIHLSVIFGLLSNKKLRKTPVKYAEFSDPLFSGNYFNVFPFYLLLGYLFSAYFNYFSIPTRNSLDYFSRFKSKSNIKIIPQGFDFNNVKLDKYKLNKVITFAYAGSFYESLRNPHYFFKHLESLDIKFKFIIYTNSFYIKEMVKDNFPNLKQKIIFKEFIKRENLISELASMDFLVNFDNENSLMVPSKLIDYALTKRPILSFSSKTFKVTSFDRFMNGDYSDRIMIDIELFNIKNITNKFLNAC